MNDLSRMIQLKVCSAGAAGNFLAPINQLSTNAFKSVMDIDVLGSYNTLKATLPQIVSSANSHKSDGYTGTLPFGVATSDILTCIASPTGTGGRIIFISATIHYTGAPLQTHVSVAKAGVDALSNAASIEFGPRGVTSNVIAPGPIGGTEGMERLAKSEDVIASKKGIPLGRWGTVKEIADATVYLFSDAANYVSGQTLVGKSRSLRQVSLWATDNRLQQSTGLHGGLLEELQGLGLSTQIFFFQTRWCRE